MKRKKIYTSEEKTLILREHLENKIPISDLAEQFGLHPNAVYKWKKQLFEQAPRVLTRKNSKADKRKSNDAQRIADLEAKLKQRESLIAEIAQENIDLKKKHDGEVFEKNGLSRM